MFALAPMLRSATPTPTLWHASVLRLHRLRTHSPASHQPHFPQPRCAPRLSSVCACACARAPLLRRVKSTNHRPCRIAQCSVSSGSSSTRPSRISSQLPPHQSHSSSLTRAYTCSSQRARIEPWLYNIRCGEHVRNLLGRIEPWLAAFGSTCCRCLRLKAFESLGPRHPSRIISQRRSYALLAAGP
jgi:hypothetical protein